MDGLVKNTGLSHKRPLFSSCSNPVVIVVSLTHDHSTTNFIANIDLFLKLTKYFLCLSLTKLSSSALLVCFCGLYLRTGISFLCDC